MIDRSIIPWLSSCVLALICVACSRDPAWSNAKPGLWEITRTNKESGAPLLQDHDQFLQQAVKNLPPEQRDRMLAQAAARNKALSDALTKAMSQPITIKSCMTAAELSQYGKPAQDGNLPEGLKGLTQLLQSGIQQGGIKCQKHVVSTTPTESVVTGTCSLGAGGTSKTESHSKLLSREAFTLTVVTETSSGPQTHRTETLISSKWLASSCDDVKEATGSKTVQQPADPCALLPAATVSQMLQHPFAAPKASAVPSLTGKGQRMDCMYYDSSRATVWFGIFFDHSASDANRGLAMFKDPRSKAVPGVGDDAFFDRQGELHVRKGNVWFFVGGGSPAGNPSPDALDEPKLIEMAKLVVAKL